MAQPSSRPSDTASNMAAAAVVISGDTRYNENVVKYGAGADLLIHEVAIAQAGIDVRGLHPAHHGPPHDGPRSRHDLRPHEAEACRLHAPGLPRERPE